MKRLSYSDPAGSMSERWQRLSLGAGISVPTENILGIFDMDTATVSPVTKKFLNTAQKAGCVSVVGEELPKSFVVIAGPQRLVSGCDHGNPNEDDRPQTQVVLSQFAPSTLVGRDGSI